MELNGDPEIQKLIYPFEAREPRETIILILI